MAKSVFESELFPTAKYMKTKNFVLIKQHPLPPILSTQLFYSDNGFKR